jgi:hypothetical protein
MIFIPNIGKVVLSHPRNERTFGSLRNKRRRDAGEKEKGEHVGSGLNEYLVGDITGFA